MYYNQYTVLAMGIGINLCSRLMLILNFSLIDSQYGDNISFITFIFLVPKDSHYEDHVTFVGIPY